MLICKVCKHRQLETVIEKEKGICPECEEKLAKRWDEDVADPSANGGNLDD